MLRAPPGNPKRNAMTSRLSITLLVMMMTNAVLFGVGAIVVLSIPALKDHAMVLLPVVIVTSFLLGPIIAWYIAPRLRARYWKPRIPDVPGKPSANRDLI